MVPAVRMNPAIGACLTEATVSLPCRLGAWDS